jgi:transcriptional regulator with XRE-family HTH domain
VGEGLTWEQVAEKLGVSVSMLMMVKRGHRNLSPKSLYRLEQAELEVADRKSQAQRVVEGLLTDKGTAEQLVGREDRNRKKLDVRVDYASARRTKACPTLISLRRPSADGCGKLRELFAQTLDTTVILLSCLPVSLRSDTYLAQLTADSRSRLTNAALELVIADWRILVAGKIAPPK